MKRKYFNIDENAVKPRTYRRMTGSCSPEIFADTKGLKLYEETGMVWLKNEAIRHSNDSYYDVIATIPNNQVLATYQLLQDMLNDKGLLDEKNELPPNPEDEEGSGFTTNWEERGLTL